LVHVEILEVVGECIRAVTLLEVVGGLGPESNDVVIKISVEVNVHTVILIIIIENLTSLAMEFTSCFVNHLPIREVPLKFAVKDTLYSSIFYEIVLSSVHSTMHSMESFQINLVTIRIREVYIRAKKKLLEEVSFINIVSHIKVIAVNTEGSKLIFRSSTLFNMSIFNN